MKKIIIWTLCMGMLGTQVQAQLSKKETKQGFVSLFDGKTTQGWRNFRKADISSIWTVNEGALHLTGKGGGDIVSVDEYENFQLELDWKISEAGNSGIFILVNEDTMNRQVYKTGLECQVLDNQKHADRKLLSHQACALYDLIAPVKDVTKPVGQYNHVKIILNKGHLEQWLNGKKMVETQLWTPEWKELVAKSKFKSMPYFATYSKGHIAFQDHGDKVWFKNIKIKKL